MTIKLTELRQNECKHLSVEDFAADCLEKLLKTLIVTGDEFDERAAYAQSAGSRIGKAENKDIESILNLGNSNEQ